MFLSGAYSALKLWQRDGRWAAATANGPPIRFRTGRWTVFPPLPMADLPSAKKHSPLERKPKTAQSGTGAAKTDRFRQAVKIVIALFSIVSKVDDNQIVLR